MSQHDAQVQNRFAGAGTTWFGHALPAEKLPLLTAVVSRFSHDLRTPLNTIAGWAQILQQAASVERTRHIAEVFARNVREETVLLEEFVDDARILLDALTLEPAEVSAADMLTDATAQLASLLDAHQVRLESHLAGSDVKLQADRARTTRLIYRLLKVAVRRAPVSSEVRLWAHPSAACLEIDIQAPAKAHDFQDDHLLDLRIASAVALLARATLEIGAPDRGSRFELRLALH
jgi:K+-sensing histidine kinase KdpD